MPSPSRALPSEHAIVRTQHQHTNFNPTPSSTSHPEQPNFFSITMPRTFISPQLQNLSRRISNHLSSSFSVLLVQIDIPSAPLFSITLKIARVFLDRGRARRNSSVSLVGSFVSPNRSKSTNADASFSAKSCAAIASSTHASDFSAWVTSVSSCFELLNYIPMLLNSVSSIC